MKLEDKVEVFIVFSSGEGGNNMSFLTFDCRLYSSGKFPIPIFPVERLYGGG